MNKILYKIKYRLLFLLGFLIVFNSGYGNNISISNVNLKEQNTKYKYVLVEFDINWENSWRTSTLEKNWDAVWIFLKYRVKGQKAWNHASLNTSEHVAPSGSTITTPSDGKGIFMYRNSNGIGSVSWADAKLCWNYGIDGLGNTEQVEIALFGIEMVYVNQEAFKVGDGSSSTIQGQFESGTSGSPFTISSEDAITLGGGSAGSLGNNNHFGMKTIDDFGDATSKVLPAEYPKGYNAFYCMKYEISQNQYVDFLNKLTYVQQATRTAVSPDSETETGAFGNTYRNGICIKTPGTFPETPAIYACNFSNNGNFDEPNDGQNIACNFLSWADLAAYLDWSGLRPMTELEYEKACRGNQTTVANEYAWGNTTIKKALGVAHVGGNDEAAYNSDANAVYDDHPSVQGPLRVGNFARTETNREGAGASYYGIMDLSGNVWERVISVGNTTERAFSGIHGNGYVEDEGNADVRNWPSKTAGVGSRGGNWEYAQEMLRISDRKYASETFATRDRRYGGRGVRTAF